MSKVLQYYKSIVSIVQNTIDTIIVVAITRQCVLKYSYKSLPQGGDPVVGVPDKVFLRPSAPMMTSNCS